MYNIDLTLVLIIYEAVSSQIWNYFHFLSFVTVLLVLINVMLCCRFCTTNELLKDFWILMASVYILIVFLLLFGIPFIAIISHVNRLSPTKIDINVVITTWIYIFWSGIVFKTMMIPVYYTSIGTFSLKENIFET